MKEKVIVQNNICFEISKKELLINNEYINKQEEHIKNVCFDNLISSISETILIYFLKYINNNSDEIENIYGIFIKMEVGIL